MRMPFVPDRRDARPPLPRRRASYCAGLLWSAALAWTPAIAAGATAGLVDEGTCQACHARQSEQWRGSHHQLAMQPASPGSVLGDFSDVRFSHAGETTRFYRKGDAYWVNTPGADGSNADFQVRYTFGVEPLQQYLLDTGGGQLQALGVAWDTRRKAWFHLYPDERVDARHPLHWSKPQQNANFMCMECHNTGFERNHDAASGRFDSQWLATGVGCQSCHGPAAAHLAWTRQPDRRQAHAGFAGSLAATANRTQVESCARCHSRRSPLGDGFDATARLLDDYLPSPLGPVLYELDGKIRDEVFEYGSFVQSRMYAKGVACSDCHDPHSARPKAEGNGVCLQCHNPSGRAVRRGIDAGGLAAGDYTSREHLRHRPEGPAGQCVACHMPGKYYMVNDLRHDHSFSVPNPARALALGLSDACLGCHAQMPGATLVASFRDWYPRALPRDGGYAQDLALVRNGHPGAAAALLRQLRRTDLPAIRRATLLGEVPGYPGQALLQQALADLGDDDPQVREAAIGAVAALLSPAERVARIAPSLSDPLRAVRLSAAYALLPAIAELGTHAAAWRRAIDEYEQAQLVQRERAEANLNLASLYQADGRPGLVEARLREALRRDADFAPARVALGQWLENAGRDSEAIELLQDGIRRQPRSGLLRYAKGLALIRQGKREAARQALAEALAAEPDNPRHAYVLAVAWHEAGQPGKAIEVLRALLARRPAERPARLALAGYLRQAGDIAGAETALAELRAINPDDPLFR
ncbi:tetratricopeptide repeat protein [Pseudomonas aeruginosa]|nr:tetratricopeptide repeat protein [Pseudomonas aeruginosa]MBG7024814.1 tetratricopeptide repeat protein [Pseudomonas aeruginosa]MBG7369055.1 tetratricopeptide repeat protein [Pseudomonas aeruginosa]